MNDLLGKGNIGGPTVNPLDYETKRCSQCGGILFKTCAVLKEIPGMAIGQGAKSALVPVNVFVCEKCGKILDSDVKMFKLDKDLETKENTENKQSSNGLILT